MPSKQRFFSVNLKDMHLCEKYSNGIIGKLKGYFLKVIFDSNYYWFIEIEMQKYGHCHIIWLKWVVRYLKSK